MNPSSQMFHYDHGSFYNLIDHLYVYDPDKVMEVFVSKIAISDHPLHSKTTNKKT